MVVSPREEAMTSQRLSRMTLWRMWCDALGRQIDEPASMTPDENFFEAGADSLMALRLHTMIEGALTRHVELADVLDALAGADFAGLYKLVDDSASGFEGTPGSDHGDH